MNLIPAVTPQFIKTLFPNLVWELPNTDKVVYLTFDDGPTPEITAWTLKTLEQYQAKATFFCIGKNVEAHPEIFNKIVSDGHSIGNHTYNHLKGWKTKTKDYIENITKTQLAFEKHLINTQPQNQSSYFVNLFRPPYGQIRPKQIKELIQIGYKIIMWNVLSIDWDNTVSKENCLKNVVENAKSGDIIVFHDSLKASKNMQYALPKVLESLSEKGFEFRRIPE